MTWLLILLLAGDIIESSETSKIQRKISLKREIVVGEAEIFSFGSLAIGDDSGRFFVLDPGNFRVLVYDDKGKETLRFGRVGEGPGEFKEPNNIALTPDGRIAVWDTGNKRMMLYDQQGKVKDNIRFELGIEHVISPFFLENGNILFTALFTDSDVQVSHRLMLYDKQMKHLKTFKQVGWAPLDFNRTGDPNFWVEFARVNFEAYSKGMPLGIPLGKGFLGLCTDKYEGTFHSESGEEQNKFRKTHKPKHFSDDLKETIYDQLWEEIMANPGINSFFQPNMKRKAMAAAKGGDIMPPLTCLFRVGSGFGTLFHYDPIKLEGKIDIFDEKGQFLGQTLHKGSITHIFGTKNHLYISGANEDENIVITRYRIQLEKP